MNELHAIVHCSQWQRKNQPDRGLFVLKHLTSLLIWAYFLQALPLQISSL